MRIQHKQQKITWSVGLGLNGEKGFSSSWGGNWSLGCNGTTGFRSSWTGDNWRTNSEWSERNWFR